MIRVLSTSFVGFAFIPVTIGIFILLHLRHYYYYLDTIVHKINDWADSTKKQILISSLVIGIAFTWSIVIGSLVFPYSDVDEAMVAAIRGFFLEGKNPYVLDIIPHILLSQNNETVVYGTYNYGPIDLLVYGLGYILLSGIFGNIWWLFALNTIFIAIIYFIISKIYPEIPFFVKLVPFSFLMEWFLQDNAVLMALLLTIAWYIHKRSNLKYKYQLVTLVLTIGVLTKLYLAFVVLCYFVYEFKYDLILWIENIVVGAITALVILVPFGLMNVINSIIIFQTNLSVRGEFAIISGGIPAILSFLGIDKLFIPVAIFYTIMLLMISKSYAKEDVDLKFAVATIFFLLLLPNSEYALYIIPAVFIVSQYYENQMTYIIKAKK